MVWRSIEEWISYQGDCLRVCTIMRDKETGIYAVALDHNTAVGTIRGMAQDASMEEAARRALIDVQKQIQSKTNGE